MAQCTNHEQNDACGRAHTTQSLDYTYDNMNNTVNALTADWMVGAHLWRALGDALQGKVQDVHKEHMPSDSGGSHTINRPPQRQNPMPSEPKPRPA